MGVKLGKFWETVRDREAWHAAVQGVMKSQTWLSDWITTTKTIQESINLKLVKKKSTYSSYNQTAKKLIKS